MSALFSRPLLVTLLVLPLALLSMGNGQKIKNSYLVTAHIESTEEQAPKFATPMKLGPEMRQYYFSKIPDLTDKMIAYYYPFVSRDGKTYGVAFQMNTKGRNALKSLTLTNQGKLLGIRIVPGTYTAVYIDAPVDDGVLVVWDGITKQQLNLLGKKFPHADQVVPPAESPAVSAASANHSALPAYPNQ